MFHVAHGTGRSGGSLSSLLLYKMGSFIAGDNLCHKDIVLLNNIRVRICLSLSEPYHRKKQQ